ncbi:PAS domain-containing methyl-accepting chemotaxis protein [Uliginosibacterium paludis]|uniref:Methyl-accepting chemotaxis protein n=1 Tax=Uliginosibacterium paludis TaxID=1615952 RepID=A0ABV2CU63_9RHOO
MRNNQPVTGQEYILHDGAAIISRTNAKGRIVACNEEFVEASGFSEEELLGQPHNIVRHPDMPPEAFRDLWQTLASGHAWTGFVKNRRKNGDHYWVRATAAPLSDGSGHSSVRIKPSRAEVAEAEALYARMRSDPALRLEGGRVVRQRRFRLPAMKLSMRLAMMAIVPLIAILILASLNLKGLYKTGKDVTELHDVSLEPMEQMAEINDLGHLGVTSLLAALVAPDDKARIASLRQESEAYRNEMEKRWQAFAASPAAGVLPKMAEHGKQREATSALVAEGFSLLDAGKPAEAGALVNTRLMPALKAQEDVADGLKEDLGKAADEAYGDARDVFRTALIEAVLLVVLASVCTLVFLVINRNHVLRNLEATRAATRAIASGDLIRPLPPGGNDEFGELISDVAIMRNALHELIAGMRQNAEALSKASCDLSRAAEQSAEASTLQASTASGMAAAVEQLSVSISMVDAGAQEASSATRRAYESSGEGGEVIRQASSEMRVIASAIEAASGSMAELQALSTSISGIVEVIREVADQTNLLALNAAIEAARAGEQGRGFAVVADEVRKLAERTGRATGEIGGMIAQIQSSASRAVLEMEDSVRKASSGLTLSEKAASSIKEIVEGSQSVLKAVSEISNALKEQSAATHDITQRVEEVARNSDEGSHSAEQVADSARHLEALAAHSRQLAELFRIA